MTKNKKYFDIVSKLEKSNISIEEFKNLATQKKIMVNKKHVSRYSVPLYGKLIMLDQEKQVINRKIK